jgi:hypothetical protein
MLNDPAFMLYAMECEGDVDTRQGKINKVIKILSQSADPNDEMTQMTVFDSVGLDGYSLSNSEVEYIEREVSNRWNK